MDRSKLLLEISRILVDEFEVAEDCVKLESRLYEDLDIDSIDAVDLLVRIRELTGQKIPPESFQQVRTIGDVIDKLSPS